MVSFFGLKLGTGGEKKRKTEQTAFAEKGRPWPPFNMEQDPDVLSKGDPAQAPRRFSMSRPRSSHATQKPLQSFPARASSKSAVTRPKVHRLATAASMHNLSTSYRDLPALVPDMPPPVPVLNSWSIPPLPGRHPYPSVESGRQEVSPKMSLSSLKLSLHSKPLDIDFEQLDMALPATSLSKTKDEAQDTEAASQGHTAPVAPPAPPLVDDEQERSRSASRPQSRSTAPRQSLSVAFTERRDSVKPETEADANASGGSSSGSGSGTASIMQMLKSRRQTLLSFAGSSSRQQSKGKQGSVLAQLPPTAPPSPPSSREPQRPRTSHGAEKSRSRERTGRFSEQFGNHQPWPLDGHRSERTLPLQSSTDSRINAQKPRRKLSRKSTSTSTNTSTSTSTKGTGSGKFVLQSAPKPDPTPRPSRAPRVPMPDFKFPDWSAIHAMEATAPGPEATTTPVEKPAVPERSKNRSITPPNWPLPAPAPSASTSTSTSTLTLLSFLSDVHAASPPSPLESPTRAYASTAPVGLPAARAMSPFQIPSFSRPWPVSGRLSRHSSQTESGQQSPSPGVAPPRCTPNYAVHAAPLRSHAVSAAQFI